MKRHEYRLDSLDSWHRHLPPAGAPGARDVDLTGADIALLIELNVGDATATIRTTDLSHAYVEENSAYSS